MGMVLHFTGRGRGTEEGITIKGGNSSEPFTYQFMMMKINTKITNIQIMTPMVNTKTRTASMSGRLDVLICNSKNIDIYNDYFCYKQKGNG